MYLLSSHKAASGTDAHELNSPGSYQHAWLANLPTALGPPNKNSPTQVHFIIASCENMVAGKGLRPGDVLTAANGKTVEVNK